MTADITCLCHGGDDLDRAIEIPHVYLPGAAMCLEPGPHHHLCNRGRGHTGRHAEVLAEAAIDLVVAVWP